LDIERQGVLEFRDNPVTAIGEDLRAGNQAPEFSSYDNNWAWKPALHSIQGLARIIGSLVPKLGDEPDYPAVLEAARKALA
jgi:hypothetical protein